MPVILRIALYFLIFFKLKSVKMLFKRVKNSLTFDNKH